MSAYRFQLGKPDSSGSRRVRVWLGDEKVLVGVLTPRRVTVTPARVVMYHTPKFTPGRADPDGHAKLERARKAVESMANALAGDK